MAGATFQMLLGGGAPRCRVSFLGKWGLNVSSFATSIGAAESTRVLVVVGTANILGSITFDGNALAQQALSGNAFVYALAWPTGTSGTFGVTGSAFFELSSYVLYGSQQTKNANLAGNGNITKYAGGAVFGAVHANSGSGHSWTGVTADWSDSASGINDGGAHAITDAAGTLAVSVSPALSAAYASWKPI